MVQPSDLEPEKLESRALDRDSIRTFLADKEVERVVVIPKRAVHIRLAKPQAVVQ